MPIHSLRNSLEYIRKPVKPDALGRVPSLMVTVLLHYIRYWQAHQASTFSVSPPIPRGVGSWPAKGILFDGVAYLWITMYNNWKNDRFLDCLVKIRLMGMSHKPYG